MALPRSIPVQSLPLDACDFDECVRNKECVQGGEAVHGDKEQGFGGYDREATKCGAWLHCV